MLDTIRLNHASRHNHAFGLDSFKVNNIWSNIVIDPSLITYGFLAETLENHQTDQKHAQS